MNDVAVVVPARDEADRIEATVRAARDLDGVDVVVVVDDGSTDHTGDRAHAAGALVLCHDENRGKGAAMVSGAEAVRLLEEHDGRAQPRHLLFLDADLGGTAAVAGPLATPVRDGSVDMTICVMPGAGGGGGHGLVVRLSRDGIHRATGWHATQPLNGMRCLTRRAFEAARPLAHGWGVETALTIDLLRAGYRVREVEVPFQHRVTGTDLAGQLHRAHQFVDVARALALREFAPSTVRRLRVALARARRPGT